MSSSSSRSIIKVFLLFCLFLIPLIAFDSSSNLNLENQCCSFDSLNQNFYIVSRLPSKNFKVIEVVVTGYSSVPWETDSDPFITASGKRTKVGIAATNFLPFGTKIKIPEIFGDQIFVIEDRMHPRFKDRIDIWFPNSWQAREFGIKKTKVYIL